jgi:hypothetical protein
MSLFDRNHLYPQQSQQIAEDDEIHQAEARSTPVGSGGLKAFAARVRGQRTTISIENAQEQNIPIDSAWIETRPTTIPHGGRGRDPGGWPKVIPVGVPPAVSGEPRREFVPKELRIPALPTNFYEKVGVVVPTSAGGAAVPVDIIDDEVAFPIGSYYIDNYSSVWIYEGSTGHWMAPFTIGWVLTGNRKSTKVWIRALAPAGYTQPALTAGGTISVLVSEEVRFSQVGVPIPSTQHP